MSISRREWTHRHQSFERGWWGDCRSTFSEEFKQLTYARLMGMSAFNDGGTWPLYDMDSRSVIDIGGGPVSMLLKCRNLGAGLVVDPCEYPAWTRARYTAAGIEVAVIAAEDYRDAAFYDESWCYNVLQHTIDPAAVIATARAQSGMLRIFEWVGFKPHQGHPHELSVPRLLDWIGAYDTEGSWYDVSEIDDTEHVWGGRAFHGYFRFV